MHGYQIPIIPSIFLKLSLLFVACFLAESTLRRSEEVLENIPKKEVSHTARKRLERKLSLESSQVLHSSARSPEKRRQSFTSPRTFDRKDEKSNQVMPIKGCLSPRGHLVCTFHLLKYIEMFLVVQWYSSPSHTGLIQSGKIKEKFEVLRKIRELFL